MNKRFTIFITKILTLLMLCGVISSCQDTIPQRSTLTKGKSVQDGDEDKEFSRPNGAINFKTDFCGCKNGKPVTYGNCASFCSNKNTNGQEVFYANFTVKESITLAGFGNVHGWCTAVIEGDAQNPKCLIEAKDAQGTIKYLDAVPIAGSNSVTAVIDSLLYDKTYVLTLVESTSGAKSDSIQTVKFSKDVALGSLGPLKNSPITQYACLVRQFSTDSVTGDIYYDSAYRLHFYFLPRIGVNPIPGGQADLICHDIFNPLYGPNDSATYPRFEERPGTFNLWDTMDPRFFDNDSNSKRDINEVIAQKTKNFGGGTIDASKDFFSEFKWFGSPALEDSAGSASGEQTIGFFMAPWIDTANFRSYCLTSTQYNSTNPLFMALRDVIGVDTEGLYVGEKAPETVIGADGNPTTGLKDYILIRETDLKAVWYYIQNGTYLAPTEANVKNVAVYFNYPLNKTTPFVKTSSQRIYKVKWAYELNQSSNSSTANGVPTSVPPHDRKIGCIPKF
jgi:hypothetical protein